MTSKLGGGVPQKTGNLQEPLVTVLMDPYLVSSPGHCAPLLGHPHRPVRPGLAPEACDGASLSLPSRQGRPHPSCFLILEPQTWR